MFEKIFIFLDFSIDTFKNDYKKIIPILFFSSVLGIIFQVFLNYTQSSIDSHLFFVPLILFFILLIPFVYFSSRLSITAILLVNQSIKNLEVSMGNEYRKSKELFSGYFWNTLKFMAILMLPLIIGGISAALISSVILQVAIVIFLVILVVYVILYYGMSFYVSVLLPEEKSYFQKSEELFKSNRVYVILLLLIISVLTGFTTYISYMFIGEYKVLNIIDLNLIVSSLIGIVVGPISIGVMIHSFWYLNDLSKSNQLEESTIDNI